MKRKRTMVVAASLVATGLFAASGCQYLMGKAAMEVGKKAYHKVKEDREENQREKQRARQTQDRAEPNRAPPPEQAPPPPQE